MIPRTPTAHERVKLEEVLLAARLLRPYYGRALAALRVMVVDGLGTVGVDKSWRLYVDVKWLTSLSLVEAATVIAAHEVEHLLRRHHTRSPGNIAKDAEINDDLHGTERLPPGGVTPAILGCADGLTAEDYEHTIKAQHCASCAGGSGVGDPEPWELEQDESIDSDLIAQATAADVRAHVAANGRGSVPAGVEVWAQAQVAPVRRDWRRDLMVQVRSTLSTCQRGADDWNRLKLSRRWRPDSPLRPAMIRCLPRIGVVVDTSGSMGPDTVGIVTGIVRAIGPVFVIHGDTEVTGISAGIPRRWVGGGGTDLRPLLDAADKEKVDVIVVVTDGDTPWPATPGRVPVVVVRNGSGATPSWARLVDVTP